MKYEVAVHAFVDAESEEAPFHFVDVEADGNGIYEGSLYFYKEKANAGDPERKFIARFSSNSWAYFNVVEST